MGLNSSTAGVFAACIRLREKIAEAPGIDPIAAEFSDGTVLAVGQAVPPLSVFTDGLIDAEDTMEYGGLRQRYQQSMFGAHFVEVCVD